MSRSANVSSETEGAGRRWWLLLAAVPLCFVAWLFLSVVGLATARFVPVQLTGFVVQIQGVLVGASFVLSVFAPFVVRHDRQHVAARSRWTPSRWYYLAVFPLVNVFVICLYLWRRRRSVGVP